MPNAIYDLDFKNDRYYGVNKWDALLTSSRTTVGYGIDLTGALKAFGTNVTSYAPRRIVKGVGLYVNAAVTNLFANPFAPATQTATVVNATQYTASLVGSGSMTLSGAGSGTVTAGSPVTFTASGTSLTATLSGAPVAMQLEANAYADPPVSGTSARDDINSNDATLTGAAGAVVVTVRSVLRSNGAVFGQGGGFSVRRASATTVTANNGTNALTATIGAGGTFATRVAVGLTWDGTGRSLCANGGTIATDANAMGTHTNWFWGGIGQAASQIDDVIERITIFPAARLSDATLQAEAILR